jgi:uncharacterized protein
MAGEFQAFQRAMGRHLRDPGHTPRPAGVPARRMAVYNELLFNNVRGFIDACFPVARELLGDRRWTRLIRRFYRDWPHHTPWFRDIPREFERFVREQRIACRLPRYMPDLLHYEWAELAVDTHPAMLPHDVNTGDWLDHYPILNPTVMNLVYDWPVHRISAVNRPRVPEITHVLVYRNAAEEVQFVIGNATTARLITLLADGASTGRAACEAIAGELGHPDPGAVVAFGEAMLVHLAAQGVVLGTRRTSSAAP